MTALLPVIISPTTGKPPNHGGRAYVRKAIPKGLVQSLQGFYIFGSDFDPVYPEASTPLDWSIGDHSRNGRHLQKIGTTPVGAKSFTSSDSDFYVAPLTGAQLMALGPDGSFTAFVVAKFPTPTFAAAMSTWNLTSTDGWILGRLPIAGNKYDVQTTYANPAFADLVTPSIVTDGDTGFVFELLSCVYNMPALTSAIYRMKPLGTMQTASNILSGTFSPLQKIAIGRSFPLNNFNNPVEIVLSGFFSMAVSAQGMADLQGTLKTLVATEGIIM